jgi:conjugal transfer ATP-binding protein TraC
MSAKIDLYPFVKSVKTTLRKNISGMYQNMFKKSENISKENLISLLERHNKPSDFLNFRTYDEYLLNSEFGEKAAEKFGVYQMADGRFGLIYEFTPGGYPNSKTEKQLESTLEEIIKYFNYKDLSFNFTSFSSQNIEETLEEYKRIHHCNVNVRNKHVLKVLVDAEVRHLRKWTHKSSLDIFDYRVRNMRNLFSIILPKKATFSDIKHIHNTIKGNAASLKPRVLEGAMFIELLYEIFHINEYDYRHSLDKKQTINKLISPPGTQINVNKGRITFNKNNKPTYADIYSVSSYPEDTSLFTTVNTFFDMLRRNLSNPIPSPFVNSLTINVNDVERKKEKYLDKVKWDYERLSGIEIKEKKKEPELEERFRECKEVIDKITKGGKYFVDCIWNLTILENDQQKLTRHGSAIVDAFKNKGWKIVRETFDNIALLKMLYTLPLQHDEDVYTLLNRTVPLFLEDAMKIAPIISDNMGYGLPYVTFLSPSGQLQSFDPMASITNYNMVFTGTSGSGKSYTISKTLFEFLSSGFKMRIIDVGKSYADLCKIFGGQFIDFGEEHYCLNFFTHVPTEKKTITEQDGTKIEIDVIEKVNAQNIVAIIGIMAGINFLVENDNKLSVDEIYLKGKIQQAVNFAFRYRGGHTADLRDVRDFLMQEKTNEDNAVNSSLLEKMISAMYNFADPEGSYFEFFNGPATLKFDSDFIVLELDALKDLKDLYPIVVFMLAQFSFNEFFIEYHKNKTQRSIFGVDEAPMMFGNEIVVDLLEAFYRRIRKYNGLAFTAAQLITDYSKNNATKAMYANSAWRINNKSNEDAIEAAIKDGLITPNAAEVEIYKAINPNPPHYGEMVLKSESGIMISRVKSNPYNHYILTQREEDKKIIQQIERQHGLTEIDARLYLAIYKDKLSEGIKSENIIAYINELKKAT